MEYISNMIFTETEKAHLEFVLQYPFANRDSIVDQLNNMRAEEVLRDITPYYWIMEFRPNGVNPGHGPMGVRICIEVHHGNGKAPTIFTLFERNGFVFELEIYNADSSAMDLAQIMRGEIRPYYK